MVSFKKLTWKTADEDVVGRRVWRLVILFYFSSTVFAFTTKEASSGAIRTIPF